MRLQPVPWSTDPFAYLARPLSKGPLENLALHQIILSVTLFYQYEQSLKN